VGILDYYRQFEAMSEDEANAQRRAEAAERRKELARTERLDLSQTTWPGLPHHNIANVITFIARRGMQTYPNTRRSDLQYELAERHGVPPERLILGNGAGELMSSAVRALIEPGQVLLTAWPSYPLFPIIARRAHGRAVPVNGGVDSLIEAIHRHDTRVIALASPNDPTGELLPTGELERLLVALPDGVAVLLDEALVEFADAQPPDTSLALLETHPQLLVFRSFSKAWGLAGLRLGYALGGPGAEDLLAELAPDLGVNELSQAGCLAALRSAGELVAEHVHDVCVERTRLIAALRRRGFDVSDSQANFLWASHQSLDGDELAARLGRAGVLVAAGTALGEPRHVRIGLRSPAASSRLLEVIDSVITGETGPGASSAGRIPSPLPT
jgi:histidinol-phosphate aminotransferase